MSQLKEMSKVVSPSHKRCKRRFGHIPVITWEQVGRPWPAGGENLLTRAKEDEKVRSDLAVRLLAGEGERREPTVYAKFSKRDLERAKLVVAAVAPEFATQFELLINMKYPRPRNMPGHPRDPQMRRAAIAFELLRCCGVRRPARIIQTILKGMGKYITEESIERDFRRRNKGGVFIPRGDVHRELLWEIFYLRKRILEGAL